MTLMPMVWLIGCVDTDPADQEALQVWMQNERAKHALPAQSPSARPAPDGPQQLIYTQPQGVEPFSRKRLLGATQADALEPTEATPLRAAPSQTRPPLDALPLASMRLVGSVQRGRETLAMLRVQGLIYSVRVGDRIGQDQGRVSAITSAGLVVREVALNVRGQQSERVVSLALEQEP